MQFKDYYAILNIARFATHTEIITGKAVSKLEYSSS